jgi:NADPH:quinone reductase-like Zn-dependent oxidoreductase
MRNLAICGDNLHLSQAKILGSSPIELDSIPLLAGLLETPNIDFDPDLTENRQRVLVRKIAFSCNYRDKGFMLTAAPHLRDNRYYVIGSEFVGEVVAVGREVTHLAVGDRVIGNSQYPESGVVGVVPGIPTNHGSKEYEVFHAVKLLKIPEQMPNEIAAGFSIGAQTTYSMIRKLKITPGANILVTAAKSNTSLFAIAALQKYNVNVYVTTTSIDFTEKFYGLGVKRVIPIDLNSEELISPVLVQEIKEEIPGFDCIIDPFFDLHIGRLMNTLVNSGRYITCGLYDQSAYSNFEYRGSTITEIMTIAMLNNIQIIGNCLGQTDDLANAIQDYMAGKLPVVVDSICSGDQISDFFTRTYHAKDRFGKVIYRYN